MKDSQKSLLIEVISASFIFLFSYTAIHKFFAHETFKTVLLQSPLISHMAEFLMVFVPSAEIFVALLLFFPLTRAVGLYGSFALMSLFTIYIIYMLISASHLPCSCGGAIEKLSWRGHLLLNAFLTGLSIYAIRLSKKQVFKKQEV